MEARDTAILKAIQEAYNRPDLGVEYISDQDRVVFKAGEKAKEEALKATGKYCHLHRTVQPKGYKQPIRAPGWVVFIPDTKEVSND